MEDAGLAAPDEPTPAFAVSELRIGHRLVLAASGEIDVVTTDELRSVLASAAVSGAAEVWLDLTGVEFMDSTGITAIVDARSVLSARRFALICPQGPVRRVLEIAGVGRAIAIHDTRADAHAA